MTLAKGTDETPLDDAFRQGMSLLASGLTIVTSAHDDGPRGLIATSVSSLSLNPPALLVCVNRKAGAHAAIRQSRAFCINILGAKDQAIALQFARPENRESRFSLGQWRTSGTGALALLSALAAFDCSLDDEISRDSHSIFIGRVREVIVSQETMPPLLYFARGYRSWSSDARQS